MGYQRIWQELSIDPHRLDALKLRTAAEVLLISQQSTPLGELMLYLGDLGKKDLRRKDDDGSSVVFVSLCLLRGSCGIPAWICRRKHFEFWLCAVEKSTYGVFLKNFCQTSFFGGGSSPVLNDIGLGSSCSRSNGSSVGNPGIHSLVYGRLFPLLDNMEWWLLLDLPLPNTLLSGRHVNVAGGRKMGVVFRSAALFVLCCRRYTTAVRVREWVRYRYRKGVEGCLLAAYLEFISKSLPPTCIVGTKRYSKFSWNSSQSNPDFLSFSGFVLQHFNDSGLFLPHFALSKRRSRGSWIDNTTRRPNPRRRAHRRHQSDGE